MSWLESAKALTEAMSEPDYEPPKAKPGEEPRVNVAAITGML